MITITSKKDGFRRCGIAHPETPTEYPDKTFTPGQMETLWAEPMLTVTVSPDAQGLKANEAIALVKACASLEDLDKLAAGETRKSVLDAIEAKTKELKG